LRKKKAGVPVALKIQREKKRKKGGGSQIQGERKRGGRKKAFKPSKES